MILIFLAISSCNPETKKGEVILKADMETPMGSNHPSTYNDHTFPFENRRLLKKTLYEGKVSMDQDPLKFEYAGAVPDFGDTAVIYGIFLTYTNRVSNKLLEISLNSISK